MSEPNFPNQDITETQSKGKLLFAILLGLLTFVVTPIVTIIFAIPFFFLSKISESFNLVGIIASIFKLRGLGGFFGAQFILIGFLAILSDFATAIISWLINRSKKLATITFVSALTFQFVLVAIILPATIKKSQETMKAGIEYQQFAKIGNVTYEGQEPYSEGRAINGRMVEVSLFRKLIIIIPISVSYAGTYQVHVQYSDNAIGHLPIKEVTQTLDQGSHTINIEFSAKESRGFGYSLPKSAQIQLFYLASEKELFDRVNPISVIDKEIYKQFLKDEGLDNQNFQAKPAINQFVEKKEVHFK